MDKVQDQNAIAFGNGWIPQYHLNLIHEWSKQSFRVPVDPHTFTEQKRRVGDELTIEDFTYGHQVTHRIKIKNTYLARIQDISHYEVLKEFCPNSFESEKFLASFTGWDYERKWVQKHWDEWHEDQSQFKWEQNPLVLVYEFDRI